MISTPLLALFLIGICGSAIGAASPEVDDSKIHRGLPVVSIRHMPFMVSLWLNSKRLCTGSIIGPSHVLSAAHCFTLPGNYSVLAGTVDAILNNTEAEWRTVKRVHIYSQDVFGKDLAIAELEEAFYINNQSNTTSSSVAIQPVPLAKKKTLAHSVAHIAGWGRIDDDSSPITLQAANVTIWPNDDSRCEGILETEICAFGEDGANTCFGDSGGPLLIKEAETNKWQQIGITSRGSFLCEFKGFFTPIRLYCDWIQKKTAGDVQCL